MGRRREIVAPPRFGFHTDYEIAQLFARLGAFVLLEPPGVFLIGGARRGSISGRTQKPHESQHIRVFNGTVVNGNSGVLLGALDLAGVGRGLRRTASSSEDLPAGGTAGLLEPLVVLGRDTTDVEACQQLATIPAQGGLVLSPSETVPQLPQVAPDRATIETNFLGSAALNRPRTEMVPEEVQRLTESAAPFEIAELGPEEGKDRVAAMEPARLREHKVGEETDPFRLGQDGLNVPSVRPHKTKSA